MAASCTYLATQGHNCQMGECRTLIHLVASQSRPKLLKIISQASAILQVLNHPSAVLALGMQER